MKKGNNFQIEKVQPQGVAQRLFDFFANVSLVLLIKKKRVALLAIVFYFF